MRVSLHTWPDAKPVSTQYPWKELVAFACVCVSLQTSVSDQDLDMVSRESKGTFKAVVVVSKKGKHHGMNCY